MARIASRLAVALCVFGSASALHVADAAATIKVNTTKDVVANDGRCSLREAIDAARLDAPSGAANGECIAGEAGSDIVSLKKDKTYILSIDGVSDDTNATGDLDIDTDLTIKGSSGTKIRQTVTQRVIQVLTGRTVQIERVTITGGQSPDGQPMITFENGEAGGGILNNGNLTLLRVKVSGNRTGDGATSIGGINISGSGGSGGGVANTSTLALANSTIANNVTGVGDVAVPGVVAISGSGGPGGGVFNVGTTTITGSRILANTTGKGGDGTQGSPSFAGFGGSGGGAFSPGGTFTVTGSVISGNKTGTGGTGAAGGPATTGGMGGNSGSGGGVATGGTTTITSTTVSGNVTGPGAPGGTGGAGANGGPGGTSGGGAGIAVQIGTTNLVASTVSGNKVGIGGSGGTGGVGGIAGPPGLPGSGGGIQSAGTLDARNSTISGNRTPGLGGGVSHVGPAGATVNNVTVARNVAATGGGIQRLMGTFDIDNSLVGDNIATADPDCNGTFNGDGYNLVENVGTCSGFSGTDVLGVAPKTGPLDKNGGPTKTHALKAGSPAINAGDPATPGPGACETTDQRGKVRITRCDIGAFEKK